MRTIVGNDLREVSVARRAMVGALDDWGMQGDDADVVVLLTSELVANAIRYGRPTFELSARVVPRGALRIEVFDEKPGQVVPRDEDLWAVDGRGLQMVDTLADRWGCNSNLDGKTVWFEVRLAEASSATA